MGLESANCTFRIQISIIPMYVIGFLKKYLGLLSILQIAASSNALFLKRHTDGHSRIVFHVSRVQREEKEPLWAPNGTHYYS